MYSINKSLSDKLPTKSNNQYSWMNFLIKKYSFNFLGFKSFSFLLFALLASGCKEKQAPPQAPPSPSIGFIVTKAIPFQVYTELSGRTLSSVTADIRPQVGGIIIGQLFEGGSKIKKGQPLYLIDPAPYQLALSQAKSSLETAKANQFTTQKLANRYKKLIKDGAISQQVYDEAIANDLEAIAAVKSARAAVADARLNLSYTKVASPIEGIIGRSMVTVGTLVTANQSTALASVRAFDPMYVDLTASSNDLLAYKQSKATNKANNDPFTKHVYLVLDNGQKYQSAGKLLFADQSVEESTSSFTLRASFPNPDQFLVPGLFVQALVPTTFEDKAIFIPAGALSRNTKGDGQVMVINKDNKVEMLEVDAKQLIDNQWLITKGLTGGEKVITSGLQFIKPMMPVVKSHQIDHEQPKSLK